MDIEGGPQKKEEHRPASHNEWRCAVREGWSRAWGVMMLPFFFCLFLCLWKIHVAMSRSSLQAGGKEYSRGSLRVDKNSVPSRWLWDR